jgi:hypothetical protein
MTHNPIPIWDNLTPAGFEELHRTLNELYGEIDIYHIEEDFIMEINKVTSAFKRAAAQTYRIGEFQPERIKSGPCRSLLIRIYNLFLHSITSPYSQASPYLQVWIDSELFRFAGFRVSLEMYEAATHIFDENGHKRLFCDFKKDIKISESDFNSKWLIAESRIAARNAELAVKQEQSPERSSHLGESHIFPPDHPYLPQGCEGCCERHLDRIPAFQCVAIAAPQNGEGAVIFRAANRHNACRRHSGDAKTRGHFFHCGAKGT